MGRVYFLGVLCFTIALFGCKKVYNTVITNENTLPILSGTFTVQGQDWMSDNGGTAPSGLFDYVKKLPGISNKMLQHYAVYVYSINFNDSSGSTIQPLPLTEPDAYLFYDMQAGVTQSAIILFIEYLPYGRKDMPGGPSNYEYVLIPLDSLPSVSPQGINLKNHLYPIKRSNFN